MATKTFHRGLRDLKIATWSSENSWGTAYDILGAREMSVEWVMETDELQGDDVVLDRYTKLVSVTLRLAHASVDLEALDVLMGGTLVSNASYEDFKVLETDEVPYIGIAGRIVGSSSASDLHMFIPKAKLSGNLQYGAQLNTYLIPSAQFQGVHEGTTNGMMRLRKFSAATALEIPLRTSTGGL
jgi:hypothetical protein